MRTALAIFFVVMIALLFVWRSVNSIKKGRQERRGRNRCETCGSRLEAAESQHAGTCRKCGTRQSWASQGGGYGDQMRRVWLCRRSRRPPSHLRRSEVLLQGASGSWG